MRCNTLNTFFLAQSAAGMNNMFMIIAMIAIFVFFYFSMIKPQKKQQQERMKMTELKKGDQVIMVDGLHGKVDSINDADKTVVIDADGIFLTFERMAIRRVLPTAAAPAKDVEANEAKEEKVETEEKPTESSKPEETASDKTDDTNSEDK